MKPATRATDQPKRELESTPTEADLIELENLVLRVWLIQAKSNDGFSSADRVVRTLEYLIARARHHNKRAAERRGSAMSAALDKE
jgi:hypothetical protein